MCGIFGYTGTRPASPILLDGLKTLEYRGYDSAGLYVPLCGTYKAVGPVQALADSIPGVLAGTAGIAHTRWATHGPPAERNSHPHTDQRGTIRLVHNGIIENYQELKKELEKNGHTFQSETDSEVLAHLIGVFREKTDDLPHAVTEALALVRGTYGIAVMSEEDNGTIVVARMGSPIALGIKEGEYIVASDAAPILRHTKDIVYLDDKEYAVLSPKGYAVYTLEHEPREKVPLAIEWDVEDVKKGGHAHFMLKEIMEIPAVLENSARGRIQLAEGLAKLGGLVDIEGDLRDIERVVIVGCGSAYYAGIVGKMLIEELAGIPVEVEIGSEFRYRPIVAGKGTAVLAISQSGETADTLASVREARQQGLLALAIVNVVGSTIARETVAGVYNHAGPEVSVASTKAFISQLEVLTLFAIYLGRMHSLPRAQAAAILRELQALPAKIQDILKRRHEIEALAGLYLGYDDFLYIGRKYNFASAYEGALKIKEVSYVHAEGYGAGEIKHGPIAMIDELFPTVAIMPSDSVYEKMRSNVSEIRARGGRVLAIATEGNDEAQDLADDVFYIPDTREELTPILVNVVLQLFAYYQSVLRGFNVDRPRNLAKSVTVE